MTARWTLISVLSAINFIIVGICAVSVGLLLTPLMTEFGWKNSTASGIATAYSLAALLSSPILGMLIDRFGEPRTMALGVTAVGAGFVGLRFCTSLPEFYAAFVVIGVGYGAAYYLASTTIVAKRMGEQKSLGMGVLFGAGSLGAATIAMAITWSLKSYGWRGTCLGAALLLLCMVPLIIAFIGDEPVVSADVSPAAVGLPRSIPPVLLFLSPYFLLVTAASAFAAFAMGGINYHVVPILLNAGLSNDLAGQVFGASWLLSALGSLGAGAVAARFGPKAILAWSLLLGAIGTLALILVRAPVIGTPAMIVFVLLWGATANCISQFLPILFMDRYGPEHLAIVLGVQSALVGLVGSFAPMVTGALYDAYKSYGAAIYASTAAALIAFVLVAGLRGAGAGKPAS